MSTMGPLPSSLEKGFTYLRHNVVIFLDLVTSLSTIFWVSFIFLIFLGFIFLYGWIEFPCLYAPHFHYPSVGGQLTYSAPQLLWIKHQRTCMSKYLCQKVYSPECTFMGCIVESSKSSIPALWGTFSVIPIGYHVYSHQQSIRIPLGPHSHQYLLPLNSVMIPFLTPMR